MEIASMPPCRSSKAAGLDGCLSPPFSSCRHLPFAFMFALHSYLLKWLSTFFLQLSAIDVSARTTMKGAAKCDKHCELQDSVNQ
mmetsp:Transcript_30897/g.77788  ORF Transcript_30897/g.77788 Transcript_30897/m.77788 type:complete len:84 (+) Transcript_30897:2271-2522(+)